MGVEIATSDVKEDEEEVEAEASAAGTREIVVDPLDIGDSSESSRGGIPDLEDTVYDIVHYMSDVSIDRITEIETAQRQLEVGQLITSEERVSLFDRTRSLGQENLKVRRDRDDTRRRLRRTMTITHSGMTPEAIEELVNGRVEEELAAYEETRAANAPEAENQSQNGSDGDNGNGGNEMGGNRNHHGNSRGVRPVARECTYQDFMKCQPLNFKGTEGVVRLIRTVETDAAFAVSWIELMKLMAEVYYPRNEIQKMESELGRRRRKKNELRAYIEGPPGTTSRSCECLLQNPRNPRCCSDCPTTLIDNRGQQPPFKRANVGGQNVERAYTAGNNERKVYNGPLPLCNKCKFHHEGPCTVKCGKCNKVGHLTQDFGEARGKAYVLGGGDANPDPNVVTGTFLLNNHYASILFDSGADRSFVSTTFSTLLDITPDTLDVSHAVELVDGRVSETNTVLRGCTLGLLGHPFNIDLIPIEQGSFDVIDSSNSIHIK
ncbi:putative reverse transcriptase domain-containing protein, partial [Tanacetum coccineum]